MMKNSLKRFTAVLACTALTAALALPARAAEDQPIRVGSYKGTTLEVGERSGLVIGPGGPAYTVTSSDPDTVEVEQVMNFWTAVAKAEGSAEITVSNQTGETATLTLTVAMTIRITRCMQRRVALIPLSRPKQHFIPIGPKQKKTPSPPRTSRTGRQRNIGPATSIL